MEYSCCWDKIILTEPNTLLRSILRSTKLYQYLKKTAHIWCNIQDIHCIENVNGAYAFIKRGESYLFISSDGECCKDDLYDEFYQYDSELFVCDNRENAVNHIIPNLIKNCIFFGNADKLIVKRNGKFGMLHMSGSKILETFYDSLIWVGSNRIKVCIDGKYGVFTRNGRQVIPIIYDKICECQLSVPRDYEVTSDNWGPDLFICYLSGSDREIRTKRTEHKEQFAYVFNINGESVLEAVQDIFLGSYLVERRYGSYVYNENIYYLSIITQYDGNISKVIDVREIGMEHPHSLAEPYIVTGLVSGKVTKIDSFVEETNNSSGTNANRYPSDTNITDIAAYLYELICKIMELLKAFYNNNSIEHNDEDFEGLLRTGIKRIKLLHPVFCELAYHIVNGKVPHIELLVYAIERINCLQDCIDWGYKDSIIYKDGEFDELYRNGSIAMLDMSDESRHRLRRAGIYTIPQLVLQTEDDLLKIRNLKRRGVLELLSVIKALKFARKFCGYA